MSDRSDRRRSSMLVKAVVGCCIIAISVLTQLFPIDSSTSLSDIVTPQAALAQTEPVEEGTPGDCRRNPDDTDLWDIDEEDPSQCILDVAACPAASWDSNSPLVLSSTYPEFCEISVSADDPDRAACAESTDGLVITSDDDGACVVYRLPHCSDGAQISPNRCRLVTRRTWTCPSGYKPRNEFNSCYQLLVVGADEDHRACGAGAPDFVVSTCAEYVGNDYVTDPALIGCPTYDPTSLPGLMLNVAANPYWCSFDSALQDSDCHAGECASTMALCLKRASQTGGCDSMSHSIECSRLRYDLSSDAVSLDDVRDAGCAPCVLLAFRPVSPECPTDLREEPTPVEDEYANRIQSIVLREQADITSGHFACFPVTGGAIDGVRYPGWEPLASHPSCAVVPSPCSDPSPGRISWSTNRPAGIAMVNSPLTIAVQDVPVAKSSVEYLNPRLEWRTHSLYLVYPLSTESPHNDILRVWRLLDSDTEPVDSDAEPRSIEELGYDGQCAALNFPAYELTIRRLWPDSPKEYSKIESLFGKDALAWWDALESPDETRLRTEANGIRYWDDLDTSGERTERVSAMTEEVACNGSRRGVIWCRWTPSQSGYFEVVGSGAWILNFLGRRAWIGVTAWDSRNGRLRDLQEGAGEGEDPRGDLLLKINQLGLTPRDFGINDTATGLLPRGNVEGSMEDPNLFEAPNAPSTQCPALDLRVSCTHDSREPTSAGHYVTSDPIGILVHEARVVTRQATRR